MPTPVPDSADDSPHRLLLNQLTILSPCEVAWDGMTGTERQRHCESCAKSVHNLIEHTADEAYRLVTEAETQLCVRIHRDAAGNVVTKDTLPALQPTRRSFLERWVALAASCLGFSSLIGCNRTNDSELGRMAPPVAGGICVPPNSKANPKGTRAHSVVYGNLRPPPNLNLPPLPDAIPASSPFTSAKTSPEPGATPKSTPPK